MGTEELPGADGDRRTLFVDCGLLPATFVRAPAVGCMSVKKSAEGMSSSAP